jgi:hypothetical protein
MSVVQFEIWTENNSVVVIALTIEPAASSNVTDSAVDLSVAQALLPLCAFTRQGQIQQTSSAAQGGRLQLRQMHCTHAVDIIIHNMLMQPGRSTVAVPIVTVPGLRDSVRILIQNHLTLYASMHKYVTHTHTHTRTRTRHGGHFTSKPSQSTLIAFTTTSLCTFGYGTVLVTTNGMSMAWLLGCAMRLD